MHVLGLAPVAEGGGEFAAAAVEEGEFWFK
jgi:hypothetical protein